MGQMTAGQVLALLLDREGEAYVLSETKRTERQRDG